MARIVQINGKPHVVIGDKVVPCDKNGVITGCYSEETKNAAGGMDVTIHVPCFQIAAKPLNPS